MSENEKPKDQSKEARAEKPERMSEPARPQATKFRENLFPISTLCEKEKLSPVLKAAVVAAYGWKADTQLTASEFKRKVEAWLRQPAGLGGGR